MRQRMAAAAEASRAALNVLKAVREQEIVVPRDLDPVRAARPQIHVGIATLAAEALVEHAPHGLAQAAEPLGARKALLAIRIVIDDHHPRRRNRLPQHRLERGSQPH